jgi:hypothetical protein
MGGRFNITAYVMNATLLQMATMRRLTMSFMPNAANTKAEATTPTALLSVTIALSAHQLATDAETNGGVGVKLEFRRIVVWPGGVRKSRTLHPSNCHRLMLRPLRFPDRLIQTTLTRGRRDETRETDLQLANEGGQRRPRNLSMGDTGRDAPLRPRRLSHGCIWTSAAKLTATLLKPARL